MKTSKLIVLRGNSGSGKSTVAKRLREVSDHRIAIIEQDYLRRFVLKEKETEGENNIDLIFTTVVFALERNYDVVLEGILHFPRYSKMLQKLIKNCPDNHFYYFDVSLAETLRRHSSKQTYEFGEKEMREWYKPHDITNFQGERIIPEEYTLEETVKMIIEDAQL